MTSDGESSAGADPPCRTHVSFARLLASPYSARRHRIADTAPDSLRSRQSSSASSGSSIRYPSSPTRVNLVLNAEQVAGTAHLSLPAPQQQASMNLLVSPTLLPEPQLPEPLDRPVPPLQPRPPASSLPEQQDKATPPFHSPAPLGGTPAPSFRGPSEVVAALPVAPCVQEKRFQLVVRPIVKITVGQRDVSGDTLNDFVTNGDTFNEVIQNLWNAFSKYVKGRGIKQGEGWTKEDVVLSDWSKVMQFKLNNHLVDNTKSNQAWSQWLVSSRGKTVKLLILEYGVDITKQKDYDTFLATCIRPTQTDRAGATAECSLREVASQLENHWGATFASTIAWRMWANHITRNLNRSTWQEQIRDPPPGHLVHLLRAPPSQVHRRARNLTKSGQMALDCVESGLASNDEVQQVVNGLVLRLQADKKALVGKRNIILSFLADVDLFAISDVVDPFLQMENLEDIEHQE